MKANAEKKKNEREKLEKRDSPGAAAAALLPPSTIKRNEGGEDIDMLDMMNLGVAQDNQKKLQAIVSKLMKSIDGRENQIIASLK